MSTLLEIGDAAESIAVREGATEPTIAADSVTLRQWISATIIQCRFDLGSIALLFGCVGLFMWVFADNCLGDADEWFGGSVKNQLVGQSEAQIKKAYGTPTADGFDISALFVTKLDQPPPEWRQLTFKTGGIFVRYGSLSVRLEKQGEEWICFNSLWSRKTRQSS
jgi:hypothetical protein